jgi:hypothetical protein
MMFTVDIFIVEVRKEYSFIQLQILRTGKTTNGHAYERLYIYQTASIYTIAVSHVETKFALGILIL